jgi:chaperonin cofactor prefoldin
MYDQEARKNERDKNQGILQDSIRTRDELIERKTDKIRRQYEQIEEEIKSLQDEKQRFFEMAITKEEVLKIAKDQLRQGREHFIDHLLSDHLKGCQDRNALPFKDSTLRIHLLSPERAWKLFYFAVSEKDLEKAVELLPDIGTPASEREAAIEKINAKIHELQKNLKDELQDEKQRL